MYTDSVKRFPKRVFHLPKMFCTINLIWIAPIAEGSQKSEINVQWQSTCEVLTNAFTISDIKRKITVQLGKKRI